MAATVEKGKKQGEYRVIEYIDPNAEDQLSEEEQVFQKFQAEFSDAENYASITVFRVPAPAPGGRPTKSRLVYLFECGLDDYKFPQLLAKLRDEYGSGSYRLQGRNQERVLIFNRSVEVEGNPVGAGAHAPEGVATIMKAVQEMIAGQQVRTDALVAQLTQKPDPAETIGKWVGILTPLVPVLQAFISRPAAATPPVASLLDEIIKFGKLKEVVADMGGGGGDGGGAESNFFDLAGKAIEAFGPIVGAAITSGQARLPAPARTMSAGARPLPETNNPPPAGATNGAPTVARTPKSPIKAQVDILLMHAKAQQPAEVAAEMVIDNTPDEKLLELKNFVASEGVIETMAQANPEVRKHLPWFADLKAHILRLIAEIESDTVAPDNATGPAADASNAPPAGGETGAGTSGP